MRRERKTIRYRLVTGILLAGWMAVIFSFSAQPAAESSRVSGGVAYEMVRACFPDASEAQVQEIAARIERPLRKAAHMTEYAILGLLFWLFLRGFAPLTARGSLWAWLLTVCYAASDEMHQLLVPGRSGQFSDVCVDAAGALAGLLVWAFIRKMWRRHCEKRKHPVQ